MSSRPSNAIPHQFVNDRRATTSPVEMAPQSASDFLLESHSDTILSPAAVPVSHQPHQQSGSTPTGPMDGGPAAVPLETIAETDYEVYSSCGRRTNAITGQRGGGGRGKERREMDDGVAQVRSSLLYSRQSPHPYQPPRVLITSNVMSLPSSSSQAKPQRPAR